MACAPGRDEGIFVSTKRLKMHPKTVLAYREWSGELGGQPPLTGLSAERLRWSKMETGMEGGVKVAIEYLGN